MTAFHATAADLAIPPRRDRNATLLRRSLQTWMSGERNHMQFSKISEDGETVYLKGFCSVGEKEVAATVGSSLGLKNV